MKGCSSMDMTIKYSYQCMCVLDVYESQIRWWNGNENGNKKDERGWEESGQLSQSSISF